MEMNKSITFEIVYYRKQIEISLLDLFLDVRQESCDIGRPKVQTKVYQALQKQKIQIPN
jgi:hypothetical protein